MYPVLCRGLCASLADGGISGNARPRTYHAGPVESTVFFHTINAGHTGVMNHFWSTCDPRCESDLMVRYYIDGEENASIAFHPAMAAGVGL